MAFQDQVLVCIDCNQEFIFTAGEQEFYEQKGLTNIPRRCKVCRSNRKAQQRRPPKKQMYHATCANCGAPTQVPFKPTGERPIYCRSCMY